MFKINKIKKSIRVQSSNINDLVNSKRSQEEMIGFVLIVVLVVVVGVILLGISLRKPVEPSNSPEVENFLEAIMLTTSDCAISYTPQYDNMQDLIASCYSGSRCLNGNSSCDILNSSLQASLKRAFPAGESQYDGYKMDIFYSTNETENRQNIFVLDTLNCTGMAAEKVIPNYPGNINVELEVCYKS